MIYLFKGNDKFHIDQKIDEIIRNKKIADYDIHRYDGKEKGFNFDDLMDDLLTISFFSSSKIIIYRNPAFIINDKNSKDDNDKIDINFNRLIDYIKNPIYETDFIMYSYDYSFKTTSKVYKEIIKNINVQDFNLPKIKEFSLEAMNIINKNKLRITYDAKEKLITNSNGNYQLLYDNLNKLILYGDNIDIDVINHLTDVYTEEQIFAFTNALFEKDFNKTFKILNDFYTLNYSIFYLIATLASQLRYLNQIAYYYNNHYTIDDIKKFTKTDKDYRIKVTIEIVKKFNGINFLKYLDDLSKLDESLKSNNEIDKKIRFELFLIYMMEGK